MANKRKWKNVFFLITVKSPAATLLIILITTLSLLVMAYESYTNTYLKWNAEFVYAVDGNDPFIQLRGTRSELQQLSVGSEVLWYPEQSGQWYKAKILRILDDKEKDGIMVHIEPLPQDVAQEFMSKNTGMYPVYVELMTGRVRMLNKLLKRETLEAGHE